MIVGVARCTRTYRTSARFRARATGATVVALTHSGNRGQTIVAFPSIGAITASVRAFSAIIATGRSRASLYVAIEAFVSVKALADEVIRSIVVRIVEACAAILTRDVVAWVIDFAVVA